MTHQKIRKMVAVWQKRLRLGNYRIAVAFDAEIELDGVRVGGDWARIKVDDDYEDATVVFNPDVGEWSVREANEAVVHELLHIFENGAGVAMESVEAVIDPVAYKLLESRYNHEVENMIDRLARIIVDIAGAVE